jgi:hypothetical protein
MKLTRIALYLALLLGLASVFLIARPPDTPPAIKRLEGRQQWGWGSVRYEDPLYRAPLPAPYDGADLWNLEEGTQITVVFDIDKTLVFRAPLSGGIMLDSRNWDTVTGDLAFDLSTLRSEDGRIDRAARPILTGLDAGQRDAHVIFSGAEIGTMVRSIGLGARGWLRVSTSSTADPERVEVVTRRLSEDRIELRVLTNVGWSGEGFPEMDRLAAAWGIDGRLPRAAVGLRLVFVRGP